MNTSTLGANSTPDHLQTSFLAMLPRIHLHAQIYFRDVKCPDKKAEAIAETIALTWKWHVRLAERGKDAFRFVATFAMLATRVVKSGRRLRGQERAKDVMSSLAQQRHGFVVEKLPDHNTSRSNPLTEALWENMQSPIPDQVAFRCDFPAWQNTYAERDRRLIDDLMIGERTLDVARKHGLTAGRISQMRKEFRADWERFCGDAVKEAIVV